MSVYRLTPIRDLEQSRQWQVSKILPKEVWVNAQDERDAREQVSMATAITKRRDGNNVSVVKVRSPWNNRKLVRCIRDDSVKLPHGVIRVPGGTILPIIDFEAADAAE